MKLYIKASQSTLTSYDLESELKSIFGDYVDSCYVFNLDSTDRRTSGGVGCDLSSKLRGKKISITAKCPIDENTLQDLVLELKETIQRLVDEKESSLQRTQDLKSRGLKRMTANAYTRYVLKEELGIKNASFAAPKDGSAYMLYDLPFTDAVSSTVYDQEYEDFKQEFLNILDELSNEFGFKFYDIQTPSGGMITRSKWSYKVYGPNVILDRRTNEVVEVE